MHMRIDRAGDNEFASRVICPPRVQAVADGRDDPISGAQIRLNRGSTVHQGAARYDGIQVIYTREGLLL
jgi:hypothetical protein